MNGTTGSTFDADHGAGFDDTDTEGDGADHQGAAASLARSDWHALFRLADQVGTADNTVTQIRGRLPIQEQADNGGAQAQCYHDDEFEGVVTSDGERHPL